MKKHFYQLVFESVLESENYYSVTLRLPHARLTAKTIIKAKSGFTDPRALAFINASYLGEMTDEEFDTAEE